MITPPQRLDLLRITGKQALTALIKYVYDVDLDAEAVVIDVETYGNTKHVKLTGKPGSQYFAKTALSYKAIDLALSGIHDYPFVLAIDLPITVGKVRDTMQDKYGIVLDTRDLGSLDSDVISTTHQDMEVALSPNSLRFGSGSLRIQFIPKLGLDLAALIPPTAGQALTKVGFVALPPEDTLALSELATQADMNGFVGVNPSPDEMVIPDQ